MIPVVTWTYHPLQQFSWAIWELSYELQREEIFHFSNNSAVIFNIQGYLQLKPSHCAALYRSNHGLSKQVENNIIALILTGRQTQNSPECSWSLDIAPVTSTGLVTAMSGHHHNPQPLTTIITSVPPRWRLLAPLPECPQDSRDYTQTQSISPGQNSILTGFWGMKPGRGVGEGISALPTISPFVSGDISNSFSPSRTSTHMEEGCSHHAHSNPRLSNHRLLSRKRGSQ